MTEPAYEPVIGLEVHVQLKTRTKMFCRCPAEFGAPPNTRTCPVCLGLPGALPVLNPAAVDLGVRAALAVGARVAERSKFDRKQYFYPDLPKGYQISQYDLPLAQEGSLPIETADGERAIGIQRLHLEEDAGKLLHEGEGPTRVDLNRAGVPLLEIVSHPTIRSPREAYGYLTALKQRLKYAGVSDCEMQEGSLRCDVNVSVRPRGTTALGTRAEVKNLNSFRGVERALEHEIVRQVQTLASGGRVVLETRAWDPERERTLSLRTKEGASDYRYFPEPDLPPLVVDAARIEAIRAAMPELPEARRRRMEETLGLSAYDARVLCAKQETADFFERCLALAPGAPKPLANWIAGPLREALRDKGIEEGHGKLEPAHLVSLVAAVGRGAVTQATARGLLAESIATGADPAGRLASGDLGRIDDAAALDTVARQVVASNAKAVEDYRAGKSNAVQFLVGQLMRATKGQANAAGARAAVERALRDAG